MVEAIEVRYAGVVMASSAGLRDLAPDGVFVAVPDPLPVGAVVTLRAAERSGQAKVTEVKESADPAAAGMRVRFLDDQARALVGPGGAGGDEKAGEARPKLSDPVPAPDPVAARAPDPEPDPVARPAADSAANSDPPPAAAESAAVSSLVSQTPANAVPAISSHPMASSGRVKKGKRRRR